MAVTGTVVEDRKDRRVRQAAAAFRLFAELFDSLVVRSEPERQDFQGDRANDRLKLDGPPDVTLGTTTEPFDQQEPAHSPAGHSGTGLG